MKLFVGLGNPGSKYEKNRHNIGFMVLDEISRDHGFAPWRAKFQGKVSEGKLGAEKIILLKPETFMNLSGQSVGEAMRFYKVDPADVVVFHDELDLAPGKARVKTGGGHAGHNGLRSIHAHIGADYDRVRLGIGHPGHKDRVAGYVLADFAKAEQTWLDDLIRGCSDGALALAAGDGGKFGNAVGLRVNPPRSSGGTKPQKKSQGTQQIKQKATLNADISANSQSHNSTPKAQATQTPEPDTRNPLEKLRDKFK